MIHRFVAVGAFVYQISDECSRIFQLKGRGLAVIARSSPVPGRR